MRKVLVVVVLSCLLLSACDSGNADVARLAQTEALNTDASVATKKADMSWSDEQSMIYAQVSDRKLLDLNALSVCSDSEIQQVRNYMDLVDSQLTGLVDVSNTTVTGVEDSAVDGLIEDNSILDVRMTDYLLTFMEKTPYYWQRSKTTIRGIDSKSRSVVVDVQYKTIGFDKEVKKDSTIVRGDANYKKLVESRYNKWVAILAMKYEDRNNALLPKLEADFKRYWGDPKDIIAEQRRYGNTADIFYTGNQKTYSGLVDTVADKGTGTLTVRYILVPKYVLGVNLGLTCNHLYITDFSLDKDITANLSSFTKEGYQTVTDSVYALVNSYFTCIDESDFDGLNKLTSNFAGLDKYYEDVFDSTYQKHQGYSVSLFNIVGTHITCGVTISTKERAKGSNMSLPVYTDRYYMELELVDDKLKVSNMTLISRHLEGEPAITEAEVDSTGFTGVIELNNDDRLAIEKLICDFGVLQLTNNTKSDDFTKVVDTSIATNQLDSLKESLASLTGVRKVVYLQNYQQGNSNYASVKCKEFFQDATNAIIEASSVYEFILKGGRWYIYNYTILSSIRLDTTNLQTTNSLCMIENGKVASYNSQIKSTASANLDEVPDISVSFEHKEYTPAVKKGVSEQGRVLYTRNDITDAIFNKVLKTLGVGDIKSFNKALGVISDTSLKTQIKNIVYDGVAIYMNKTDSRYKNNSEMLSVVSDWNSLVQSATDRLKGVSDDSESIEPLRKILTTLSSIVGGDK